MLWREIRLCLEPGTNFATWISLVQSGFEFQIFYHIDVQFDNAISTWLWIIVLDNVYFCFLKMILKKTNLIFIYFKLIFLIFSDYFNILIFLKYIYYLIYF